MENPPSNESECINWNLYYSECTPGEFNPFSGAISFDNIGLAWVAIFLVRPCFFTFIEYCSLGGYLSCKALILPLSFIFYSVEGRTFLQILVHTGSLNTKWPGLLCVRSKPGLINFWVITLLGILIKRPSNESKIP